MKQLRIFLIFIALSFATMLFAAEKTTTFKVKGMGWPGRAYKVSSALKSSNGVINAEASYKTHTVKVIFDDSKTKKSELKKKIESLGFKVSK